MNRHASPERALHIAVATFLRLAMPDGIPWWHTPNGEHRDVRTAAKLKAFGTRPGVPDLAFIMPLGKAAFIELKAGKGRLTEAQKQFRDDAEALGAWWSECRSVDEVDATLVRWLDPFGLRLKARAAA